MLSDFNVLIIGQRHHVDVVRFAITYALIMYLKIFFLLTLKKPFGHVIRMMLSVRYVPTGGIGIYTENSAFTDPK